MTLEEIKSVMTLVRESEVESYRRANPYFRVLPKPDTSYLPGFSLAYDPEMISDLFPQDCELTDRIKSQMEKLYQANPESFTRSVFKATAADVYGVVKNSFATDADTIAYFSGEVQRVSQSSVEEPSQPTTPSDTVEAVQPPLVQEPKVAVPQPMATPPLDYTAIRGIVKDVVETQLAIHAGTQKMILDAVQSLSQGKDGRDLAEFMGSLSELIRCVNQISSYINAMDLKTGEERNAMKKTLAETQESLQTQTKAFDEMNRLTEDMHSLIDVFTDVITRYADVNVLTDEAEFKKTLSNLDRINSPSAFMMAFKEAMQMFWYSGDRQIVEKVLVATVSFLKEGF